MLWSPVLATLPRPFLLSARSPQYLLLCTPSDLVLSLHCLQDSKQPSMNQPGYPNTSYSAQNYTNQINNGGLSGGMYGGLAGYNHMLNGYGPATGHTYQSVLDLFAHSFHAPAYGTGQERGARRSRPPLPATRVYRDRSTILRRPDTGPASRPVALMMLTTIPLLDPHLRAITKTSTKP